MTWNQFNFFFIVNYFSFINRLIINLFGRSLKIFGNNFFGLFNWFNNRFVVDYSLFSFLNLKFFFDYLINRLNSTFSNNLSSRNHNWNCSKITFWVYNRISDFRFSVNRSGYLNLSHYRSLNNFLFDNRLSNDSFCNDRLSYQCSRNLRSRNNFLGLSDLRFGVNNFTSFN